MSFNPIVIDEKSSKFIQTASEAAIQRLKVEHGVECADWKGIPTISIIFFEEIFRELGNQARNNGGEAKIVLPQLMTIGVDLREQEDAEKQGNCTVNISVAPLPKQLIKNDALTEADE